MNTRGPDGGRAVVIGLDGTPFSFLDAEIAKGNLPALAAIASEGGLTRMETEIPTISSVAWASFMTGVNPGRHGIYGFTDRKPGTYELYFPNYNHLKVEPMWERFSAQGKRCCVLNVPSTYPARELNGILVSGFVAPSLERATYPAEAYEYLEKVGYRVDVDASRGRESLDLLLEDLHQTLEKRREVMHHFWKQEDWDLFVCVFTGTDRLHHFMWRHYENEDPVYADEFTRYYKRLDEIIGEFVSGLPDGIALFMLSDHGFAGIRREVFLNAFLRQEGFLSLKGDSPRTIADIDPSTTRAYCMDPGRIYVNLEGREPEGSVSSGREYEQVCSELSRALLELKDPESGARVIDAVVAGIELYEGPHTQAAPDLVALPAEGMDLKGSMAKNEIFVEGHLTGMHTQDDAFSLIRADEDLEPAVHIRELADRIAAIIQP